LKSKKIRKKDKIAVINELRHKYNLTDLLAYANIPRSTYYFHAKQSSKEDKYLDIKREIQNIFHINKGRYGYRRITLELKNRGYLINHKTVRRLMKVLNLKSMVRIKKYKSYRGEVGRIAPNILNRDFQTNNPYEKWTTDITEFAVNGEKLYLSPILDMYNGEIVSYRMSKKANMDQIFTMIEEAFDKIPDNTNLMLHSDQGWQYQNKYYQKKLKDKGVQQSMSRKGNCLDNSVMENFFGILKSELFYLQKFESVEELKKSIVEYIDYYNTRRIKVNLKGMSPVQYREISTNAS
jgi:Transposase and inactivated derivatives